MRAKSASSFVTPNRRSLEAIYLMRTAAKSQNSRRRRSSALENMHKNIRSYSKLYPSLRANRAFVHVFPDLFLLRRTCSSLTNPPRTYLLPSAVRVPRSFMARLPPP